MSEKEDEDATDQDAKDLDDTEADEERDEDETLDQHHKSEDRSLAEEQSTEMNEEEAFEESQTDVRPRTLKENGEESASEEESVHSETGQGTKIGETSSGQRLLDTEHEEISKTKIESGFIELEMEEEEDDDEEEEETEEAMEASEKGSKAQMVEGIISKEKIGEKVSSHKSLLSDKEKISSHRSLQSDKEKIFSHTSLLFDFGEQMEEQVEEEEEEEEEDEESKKVRKRYKLLQDYKAAKADQKKLHDLNRKLQHRLSSQLKKTEPELTVQTEEELLEKEQQYITSVSLLNELHRDQTLLEKNQALEIEVLKQESQDQRALSETFLMKLLNFRKHTMTGGNKNKKSNRYRRAEQYSQTEREKWMEASRITLENILIKEEYDGIAKILKEREKFAEDLTMADFEQLKIENQSCNEKIEEKNETIALVRFKLREAVQRLTHVKQKLNFVNIKTKELRADLEEVEERVIVRRHILSETKMARDRLKRDSRVLRQKSALLCFPDLLRDYEKKIDETDAIRVQVAELRISHKDMTMEIRKLRHKIEELMSIAEATGERY